MEHETEFHNIIIDGISLSVETDRVTTQIVCVRMYCTYGDETVDIRPLLHVTMMIRIALLVQAGIA